MGQGRILEIAFSKFRSILTAAAREGEKFDPSQKAAWKTALAPYKNSEAGFRVRANAKTLSGVTDAVIISGLGDDDGYYLFSSDEQVCMKLEPSTPD
ncbi:MAG: hypothetical protein AAGH19_11795 [Pseudomonadota bacterium]